MAGTVERTESSQRKQWQYPAWAGTWLGVFGPSPCGKITKEQKQNCSGDLSWCHSSWACDRWLEAPESLAPYLDFRVQSVDPKTGSEALHLHRAWGRHPGGTVALREPSAATWELSVLEPLG